MLAVYIYAYKGCYLLENIQLALIQFFMAKIIVPWNYVVFHCPSTIQMFRPILYFCICLMKGFAYNCTYNNDELLIRSALCFCFFCYESAHTSILVYTTIIHFNIPCKRQLQLKVLFSTPWLIHWIIIMNEITMYMCKKEQQ